MLGWTQGEIAVHTCLAEVTNESTSKIIDNNYLVTSNQKSSSKEKIDRKQSAIWTRCSTLSIVLSVCMQPGTRSDKCRSS